MLGRLCDESKQIFGNVLDHGSHVDSDDGGDDDIPILVPRSRPNDSGRLLVSQRAVEHAFLAKLREHSICGESILSCPKTTHAFVDGIIDFLPGLGEGFNFKFGLDDGILAEIGGEQLIHGGLDTGEVKGEGRVDKLQEKFVQEGIDRLEGVGGNAVRTDFRDDGISGALGDVTRVCGEEDKGQVKMLDEWSRLRTRCTGIISVACQVGGFQ